MEVELDSGLLDDSGRDDLALLGLCAFGLSGRHRVVRDENEVWEGWAGGFGKSLKEELLTAWKNSEQSVGTGRKGARVRVTNAKRSLEVGGLQLPPNEAFNLLARPLRILLENGRNDRAFLLAFADAAAWARLTAAESEGWLEFETAGGIGELKARLKDVPQRSEQHLLRTLYLCDSDAKHPDVPSPEAEEVRNGLHGLSKRFSGREAYFGSVLKRRAAENYAPAAAVVSWAQSLDPSLYTLFGEAKDASKRRQLVNSVGQPGTPRRLLLAAIALKEISQAQPTAVHVLDMKQGYDGGRRTTPECWERLDLFQQAALQDGFGTNFSASFYPHQRNLSDESGEISAFLKNVSEQL